MRAVGANVTSPKLKGERELNRIRAQNKGIRVNTNMGTSACVAYLMLLDSEFEDQL